MQRAKHQLLAPDDQRRDDALRRVITRPKCGAGPISSLDDMAAFAVCAMRDLAPAEQVHRGPGLHACNFGQWH